MIEGILTAVAKFENKRKKLRCRRGIARAKEQGKTLNRYPFGYKIINKGKKDSKVVIDQEKSQIVKDIFSRYVNQKQSMYKIARELNLSKSNIRYILKNRFYCDPTLNGDHKTIVDIDTFQKANNP